MEALIKDMHKTKYGIEGTMYYPLFDKKINVHFYDSEAVEYAQCYKEEI